VYTSLSAREQQLAQLTERRPAAAARIASLADQASRDLSLRLAAVLIDTGALDDALVVLRDAASESRRTTDQTQLGELWLRLARALQRAGRRAEVESALKNSADSQFAPGLVALARHLRRDAHRTDETIALLRDAIRLAPAETAAYFELARLLGEAERPEEALRVYLQVLDVVPNMANTLMVAESVEGLLPLLADRSRDRGLRIALLGNATLDQLKSFVKVDCLRAGLVPTIYQSGFDQYMREILDAQSPLYAFQPQVVTCAIHASRLFPALHQYPFDLTPAERRAEMEAGLATLQHMLDAFAARSQAMFLLHNMVQPHYPALGILDSRDELGQAAIFSEINMRLAELVRGRYKNVYLVDEERVQSHCGKARATDPRMWFTARMPWSEEVLGGLSREYMRYVAASHGLTRKCIVVDLDNTLWGGVVGEDGASGIQLGSEAPGNAYVALQNELEKLSRRGVLLAICSKNNLEDALPVLESHPEMVLRMSHFAAVRINWASKPTNIREIARELNIGLDSLVFLDDNPVERAAVRSELPEVLAPELPSDPAGYRRALLEVMGAFDALTLTTEDRERNRLYAEQRLRQESKAQLEQGGSLDDYLADLAITVEIEEANDVSLPRIAQLTGKTNQFNLTTRRYTVAEISHKQSAGARVLSARVRDRFGDNGLTAVAIIESDSASVWSIDTLLLSCRVMGRGIETTLLSYIVDMARQSGVRLLRGSYLPTAKNSVVRSLYADHGFTLIEETGDGHSSWQFDVEEQAIRVPAWVQLQEPLFAA
jgi:FkbH-like protein